MTDKMGTLRSAGMLIRRNRGLIIPLVAASLIFIVLVPVPPFLLDILLASNITLAAIVLLTTIYAKSPLEFSVFPSLLLGTTLSRLVLNIASTRLIITAGSDGRTAEEASRAAGNVIHAFSSFVTSGSLAVGVILFIILVAIQFLVVTKGGSRISEVAARFVLDAMPGKQMAIDADLNAGLIDQKEAFRRREDVTKAADFYGAMDGASKFIRGDVMVAVVITVVNILGGLYVGMVEYAWSFDESVAVFTRLTIGDGLVTQVPAFLISISAALVVSRSSDRADLGEQVISQLTARPVVLVITAAFLGLLTLTELPKAPLLLLGTGCAMLAFAISRDRKFRESEGEAADAELPAEDEAVSQTVTVDQVISVDPMRIELGYALVRLVDPSQPEHLLDRIVKVRRQVAMELGLLVPPVTIRDNMRLDANAYVVTIRGVQVAKGKIYPDQLLAVAAGDTDGEMEGRRVVEPTSGCAAVWIDRDQVRQAEKLGYSVAEAIVVLAVHVSEIIRNNAGQLLSRQQVAAMFESLAARAPSLVKEFDERFVRHLVHKVLQNLLSERVAIRDLEAILEAMCEQAGVTQDAELLSEHVRRRLGKSLSQQYSDDDGMLWCVSLSQDAEDSVSLPEGSSDNAGSYEPEKAIDVSKRISEALTKMRRQGKRPVVLCAPHVRRGLREMLSVGDPDAAILAYNEIDSVEVKSFEHVEVGI